MSIVNEIKVNQHIFHHCLTDDNIFSAPERF